MSSHTSVDRAPAWCSGGHGFDSCRGLRIFLCPTLVSCWLIHLHIIPQSISHCMYTTMGQIGVSGNATRSVTLAFCFRVLVLHVHCIDFGNTSFNHAVQIQDTLLIFFMETKMAQAFVAISERLFSVFYFIVWALSSCNLLGFKSNLTTNNKLKMLKWQVSVTQKNLKMNKQAGI